MKKIRLFLLAIFSMIIHLAYADTNDYSRGSFFRIESISYENTGDNMKAHIILNNGYQFVVNPKVEEEYILADLEENYPVGKEIVVSIMRETPSYALEFLDGLEGAQSLSDLMIRRLKVSLAKETVKMLPTVEKIEKVSTGWFSSELYVLLSDGSRWKCGDSISYYHVETWKKGQKIMFARDISNLSRSRVKLINIHANYAESFTWDRGVHYFDRREVSVESAN